MLFRRDTAESYRLDRLGNTRGVACFTSSDGDVLFPGNGSDSRLTARTQPAFSVTGSLFRRGEQQREEERNSLVGRIRRSVLSTTESTGR